MEFLDVVKARVSCRAYNGREVADDDLPKILEVMELAPTAGHLQSYRVRVSKDPGFVREVGEIAGQEDRIEGCGAVMMFFAVPEDALKYGDRGRNLYSVQDATLACAYAQLAAAEMGMASLWIGSFDDAEALKLCGLVADDGLKPVAVLVLGYTDEKLERPERRPMEQLVV